MAGSSFKDSQKMIEDKTKLILVLLQKFINERNPREKQMITIFGILAILFLDYWLLINPVVKIFTVNLSQSGSLKSEIDGLKKDRNNEKLIEKGWEQAKEKLAESEKRFVSPNEMPTLLENISKLAQSSGVKVLSLQPVEKPDTGGKKDVANPYVGFPIRISAIGGTHEIGKFLALLETNPTFIRVVDIRISSDPMDERKHVLELSIEVYRKEAQK